MRENAADNPWAEAQASIHRCHLCPSAGGRATRTFPRSPTPLRSKLPQRPAAAAGGRAVAAVAVAAAVTAVAGRAAGSGSGTVS